MTRIPLDPLVALQGAVSRLRLKGENDVASAFSERLTALRIKDARSGSDPATALDVGNEAATLLGYAGQVLTGNGSRNSALKYAQVRRDDDAQRGMAASARAVTGIGGGFGGDPGAGGAPVSRSRSLGKPLVAGLLLFGVGAVLAAVGR